MTDELTEVGFDGIRRSFDEHYDTIDDVEQDPTGAMGAIHKQHARIEELEAKLAEKLAKAVDALGGMLDLFSADYVLLKGTHLNIEVSNARNILAELKGETE